MKLFAALVGAGSLLAGGAALAQNAPGPAPAPAPAQPPAGQMGAPEADISDAQIESFAAAALQIQELQSEPVTDQAAMQQQAMEIVTSSGLTPESYNMIARATQTNPEVAERVQLAVANMQGQSES